VRTDYQNDYVGLKAVVKEDVALRLGVTKAQIAQALGAKIKGYPVSQMWEGKAIDIVLRTDESDRKIWMLWAICTSIQHSVLRFL
jgi:multidrug efflux pump subunit AcrB